MLLIGQLFEGGSLDAIWANPSQGYIRDNHCLYIDPIHNLFNCGAIPAEGLRHRIRVFGRVARRVTQSCLKWPMGNKLSCTVSLFMRCQLLLIYKQTICRFGRYGFYT